MSRFVIVTSLLLAAGCTQQGKTSTSNEDAMARPLAEPAAVPALDGEWQVTKVDGRPIAPAMTAAFEGGRVRITAGCARRAWTFTQKRNIVSFAANPGGSANCEVPPTVKQEEAFQALDRATIAIFAKEGREASLSGDGGNVTLVRG